MVGLGRATELLMLGDRVEAEEALRIGLANRVVAPEALDREVEDLARRLMERAPWGLAMTKEMLNRAAAMDYSSAIEMEAWTQTLLMTGKDFGEFHASFRAKRPPDYRGR
jgi:enoyl-CoA hydratase/carnithine racemase